MFAFLSLLIMSSINDVLYMAILFSFEQFKNFRFFSLPKSVWIVYSDNPLSCSWLCHPHILCQSSICHLQNDWISSSCQKKSFLRNNTHTHGQFATHRLNSLVCSSAKLSRAHKFQTRKEKWSTVLYCIRIQFEAERKPLIFSKSL